VTKRMRATIGEQDIRSEDKGIDRNSAAQQNRDLKDELSLRIKKLRH
jgi:hypothetical protein